MSTLTRKQFLLGGLAATATLTVLGACADDPQPSDDDVGETGESDTTESGTGSTSGESTSEEESTSETDTVDTTTEDETTGDTTDDTDTTDDGTDTTDDTDTTDSTETGDEVCPDGASGTVLLNHGHELIIPTEDVQAAVQKVYDVQGGAAHNHQVTITPADFAQLALGNVVMKTTTFIAEHDHEVLVSCLL